MEKKINNRSALRHSLDYDDTGVWRYLFLLASGWAQFALYFLFRGYQSATVVSCAVLSAFLIFYLCAKKINTKDRTNAIWIVNSYIGIHCVGIITISLANPSLESNLLAIPIGMIIVYMLLGIAAALAWLIVTLVTFALYPVLSYELWAVTAPAALFDDIVLKVGACIVLFLCLKEFEGFFGRRAKELFKLSQELEEKSVALNNIATIDALTGLPNRYSFNSILAKQVEECLAKKESLALLMLDMDRFKQVNDTLGHVVGDEALCTVAKRLQSLLEDGMYIARLGGDEFCILIRNPSGGEKIQEISLQIHKSLCEQYELSTASCQLGVSIGIAICPNDAKSTEELMAYADTAMFHAKDNLQPYAFYRSQQTERVIEYSALQDKLSQALKREEYFLVYQPQFDVDSGKVVGAEALLRWNHDGEIIPPFKFIPHLESSRQIINVTQWVLNTVCAQINQWNEIGFRTKIAVNISAVDFHESRFLNMVVGAVREHGIDANQLELEVTEGVFIDKPEEIAEKLRLLKQQGITISIDDFGTGYSSLAYIRELPLNKLKIDRAFIKNIPDEDDGIMAQTIVFLAKRLGLEVLAEGVETETQLQFLKENGCHFYQGFLSSKPILASEFQQLVQSSESENKAA